LIKSGKHFAVSHEFERLGGQKHPKEENLSQD